MLQNIILYMASSAAQVWAALMVFVVFVVRDARAGREAEILRMQEHPQYDWNYIVERLRHSLPAIRARNPTADFDATILDHLNHNTENFSKLIKFVSELQLVKQEWGNLLGADWPPLAQSYFDGMAKRIRLLEQVIIPPSGPYIAGSIAIMLNLIAIALAYVPDGCNGLWLKWSIGGILLINCLIGVYVLQRALRIVKL